MNKTILITAILMVSAMVLFGCTQSPDTNGNDTNVPDDGNLPLVGGDKDEHGCIGSAGYSWCEAKQKCLRVWEEACGAEEELPLGIPITESDLTVEDEPLDQPMDTTDYVPDEPEV